MATMPTTYPPSLPHEFTGEEWRNIDRARQAMRAAKTATPWADLVASKTRTYLAHRAAAGADREGGLSREMGFPSDEMATAAAVAMLLDVSTQHIELGSHVVDLEYSAVSALFQAGPLTNAPVAPLRTWLQSNARLPGHPPWAQRQEESRMSAPVLGFSGIVGCVRLERPLPCRPRLAREGTPLLWGFYWHCVPGMPVHPGREDGGAPHLRRYDLLESGGSLDYQAEVLPLVTGLPDSTRLVAPRGGAPFEEDDPDGYYLPPLAWDGGGVGIPDYLGILSWVWKILEVLWREEAVFSEVPAPRRVQKRHPKGPGIRPLGPWRTLRVAETLDRVHLAARRRQEAADAAAAAAEAEAAAAVAAEEARQGEERAAAARAAYFVAAHTSWKWVLAESATEKEREAARAEDAVRLSKAGSPLYRVRRDVREYSTSGEVDPLARRVTKVRGPRGGLIDL